MQNVLMVGEDTPLLAKRAAILSQSGASVTYCSTAELDMHLWNEGFDLVVLCHTLKTGVQRSVVVAAIYRRWPQARVLQIVKRVPRSQELEEGRELLAADLVTGDLGEQGELLPLSMELLGKSAASEWQSFSDHFYLQPAC